MFLSHILTHVFLFNNQGPSSPYAGVSVSTISKPERSPALFPICPIPRRRQRLLDFESYAIQPVKSHHLSESCGSSAAHPSSWEVHHFEFIGGDKGPALRVPDGDEAFPVPLHLIAFNILARSKIEDFLIMEILFRNRTREGPHDVTEADWWTHMWSQIHCSKITIFVYHWDTEVNLVKVNSMPIPNVRSFGNKRSRIGGYSHIVNHILGR